MTLIRKPEKPKRSPLLNLKLTHKKYAVVEDVPRQCLLVGGVEVKAPLAAHARIGFAKPQARLSRKRQIRLFRCSIEQQLQLNNRLMDSNTLMS